MIARFVPLSKRDDPDASRVHQEVLYEDVPDHLYPTLLDLIPLTFKTEHHFSQLERELEIAAPRYRFGEKLLVEQSAQDLIKRAHDDGRLLDVLDHRLQRSPGMNEFVASGFEDVLREAGSAWGVVEVTGDNGQTFKLQRRVGEQATDAAARAAEHGKSGLHLGRAWELTYGRSPDPSEAYDQAVKAVEVAARPVVSPKDSTATLGTIIGHMKGQPGSVVLGLDAAADSEKGQFEDVSGEQVTRMMMQLLWRGQTDRHGDPDPAIPISVSQAEAEAAVHLAVLLVQWFETGVVRPA